jgi:uncharacterized protein (TIGR03032 family)
MNQEKPENSDELLNSQAGKWRDPAQIISQWTAADQVNHDQLKYRIKGKFFESLGELGITLFVTREYEHIVQAFSVDGAGIPLLSYMSLPHPSGIVADRKKTRLYIASTRNPNQVFTLKAASGALQRDDKPYSLKGYTPLVPVGSSIYPGCLYMHDLALINGDLYATASGNNAVVRLHHDGAFNTVWWPRCIEMKHGPIFGQNHIQLNSIAAGKDIKSSFFSASSVEIASLRPGHRNYPVDKRGVIFDGKTREPIATGLTRPHSARLHRKRLWVDNSGYGEFGYISNGSFTPVIKLPGWTRGLCFHKHIAFVGTSRIIPRFRRYAPGVDMRKSFCGIHAIDITTGRLKGSIIWPNGNQIFSLDWIKTGKASALPFVIKGRRSMEKDKRFFYSFDIGG